MIKNHEELADYIGNWTKRYVDNAGQLGVVLGLSGGIDSALVALLCLRAGVRVLCVNMPCHSSASAFERAQKFAEENHLPLAKVDLSDAHGSIVDQFKFTLPLNDWDVPGANAALRSCLRAPTLSFFAHATKSLIVGTGNRSEDHITRYFQKFGDGCVDFSPIADLFKSEVYDLFKYLATDGGTKEFPEGAKAIYDAKPSADLWGADSGQEDEKELGLTYDEIEWGDREDMRFAQETILVGGDIGIIFSDTPPETRGIWGSYTERQRHIISTLHRMEKISRHKSNPNQPVCEVRTSGLVE